MRDAEPSGEQPPATGSRPQGEEAAPPEQRQADAAPPAPATDASAEDTATQFKLERYKFILQEIHTLNDNVHKYLGVFQALATALVGGAIAIFVGWRQLQISAEIAHAGVRGLLIMLTVLGAFAVVVMVVGIRSWFDFRKEEVEVLNDVCGPGYRKPPRLRNLYYWQEVWLIIFIVLLIVLAWAYVEVGVLPLMQAAPVATPQPAVPTPTGTP